MPSPPLSNDELRYYQRHIGLAEVGVEGQQRLKNASVLIVGVGGLGCPAAQYLAAAGIGRIGLIDHDLVDESNLHRQVLFGVGDVGRPKVEVATSRLRATNPYVEIESLQEKLTAENAERHIANYDIVCDGSDNFATRYVVNDVAIKLGKPVVYASISEFDGQASVFGLDGGPCYRCLFPQPPAPDSIPSCADGGVLGVLPGLLGTIQATEVVKIAIGMGESLSGTLLMVDSMDMTFRRLSISKNPDCPVCRDSASSVTSPKPSPLPMSEITVQELNEQIQGGNPPRMLDVRQPEEAAICTIGGDLIPLGLLPFRIDEVKESFGDEQVVVYCKAGGRSMQAIGFLKSVGIENVVNLRGGMMAWWAEIDPEMPRY